MMKCNSSEHAIAAWTDGSLDNDSLAELHTHILSCQTCSEKYSDLLPLLERDMEIIQRTSGAFIDDVMAALPDNSRRSATKKRFLPIPHPYLIAAASAIFMVGLGLGVFFARFDDKTVTIRFVLSHPHASSVHLAGNFNRWNDKDYAMKRIDKTDTWEIEVPLEKGKVYVYNFVIDENTWIADPEIPVKIDDGFGGSGSLLRL